MRGSSDVTPITSSPRGLTRSIAAEGGNSGSMAKKSMNISMSMASKAMKLKLSGKISPDVGMRKQVGDTEAMMFGEEKDKPWWKNVGMDEGI